MGGFDQNFQSLVKLKKDALGLQADQQAFNQNESLFRREGDLQAQRLVNERSRFDIDRAKGFMPIDMANARMGLQNTINGMSDQQDQSAFNKQMNRLTFENRTSEQLRGGDDYNYQTSRQRMTDARQDANYGYQAGRQRTMDAQVDADRSYQTGRRNVMDQRSDAEYEASKAISYQPGYGSSPHGLIQPQQGLPAIRSSSRYADGGQIQDAAPKGFSPVPVRVSNGEYEFTPEQVANIGASVLASQNQGATPVGLDSMD